MTVSAVDEMLVKVSSLVGGNPEWHTGDPLTISFKKVSAAETVRALWDKVCPCCARCTDPVLLVTILGICVKCTFLEQLE